MTQKLPRHLVLAAALAALSFATAGPEVRADGVFLRGDVNADGRISISDVLMLRRWLFNGDRPPPCMDAADLNDEGRVDLSDAIWVLNFAFRGGPSPPAPFPEVGPDPDGEDDGASCASYEAVPPEETGDLVRLGDVQALSGTTVDIPVYITNSVAIEAYQLAIRYDPAVFVPRAGFGGSDGGSLAFEGTFY